MTWILKTGTDEATFTDAQAVDRLVKRRAAKDVTEAQAMLAKGKPIVIPASGGTAEQTLVPVKEAKSGAVA